MKQQMWILLILSLSVLIQCQTGCDTFEQSLGCKTCLSTSDTIKFNLTSNKFTCFNDTGCLQVTGSLCTSCRPGFLLSNTSACVNNTFGCQTLSSNGSDCSVCMPGYIINGTSCIPKFMVNCNVDNVIVNSGVLECSKCLSRSLSISLNCLSVDTTVCVSFDFQTFRCTQCPSDLVLSSNGDGCHYLVQNCEAYNLETGLCFQCRNNFILSIANPPTCLPTSSLAVKSLIYSSVFAAYYLCLDSQQKFDLATGTCVLTGFPAHCDNTTCQICLPGYYSFMNTTSSVSSCLDCSISLQNCAYCSNNTICQICDPQYYLLNTEGSGSKCMSCISYGCQHCWVNSSDSQGVFCLSCPDGSTLYQGSCFACDDGESFSVLTGTCISCSSILNCLQCQFIDNPTNLSTSLICLKCNSSYYLSTTYPTGTTAFPIPSTVCIQISTVTWANVNELDQYQYLVSLAPGIELELFNDRVGLMSACATETDGYVCICSNVSQTSLCTSISNISTVTTFEQNSKNLDKANVIRMLTQFPNFDFLNLTPDPSVPPTTTPSTQFIITENQLANYLAAATLAASRANATSISTIVNRIKALSNRMEDNNIFSDQKITIIEGNGFYFKHIPVTLKSGGQGDDDFISTTSTITNNGTTSVTFYVRFDRDANITNVVTGKIYIFCKNISTAAAVTVVAKKTRYVENTGTLSVSINGAAGNLNITQSQGKYTIVGFPISSLTNTYGQVSVGVSTESEDPYSHQRIENIFDSQSWIYILFFVVVYLVFIPFCSMVDCCETKQNLRKRVGTDQSEKESSEASTVVRVNYRQFFPLYNIGNTPRPRRLQKLCLFIVNMQHSVTFLTLIYFNFQGGHEVVAIVLVIPAYLCTVVMGYICGLIFRYLPGNFKYFINLFSLGYWIMWIFLMRIMSRSSSQAYWPYLLTFSILCNVLDVIIDSLQMLLVYFSLRQEQQQIQLYRCLAQWLSWRGYYEYDKLSRQLGLENQ